MKDMNGMTALFLAAFMGHGAIVRHLVERGADVNCQNKDGGTPVMAAADFGHEAILKYLIENDADIHLQKLDWIHCPHCGCD